MNPKFKIILYVVLGVCLASFGAGFYAAFHAKDEPVQPSGPGPSTNVTATAGVVTNADGVVVTNQAPVAAATAPAADDDVVARKRSPRAGRLTAFGVGMFFTVVGLAIMIGYDVSKFFATRVNEFIFNEDLHGTRSPEYEEAENVWAKGDHLGAIGMMREYLNRNPREQYVALRIAEIYESDLRNYLAAALEYEEILKKKLPAERWGWAAIHLSNLYSGKLNKTEQATALLHRIVEEFGQTAAAKKARERLGLPEPVETPVVVAVAAVEPVTPPAKDEPPGNLPKGFRPK